MKAGLYPDVPEQDYHSDPALSHSGAKDLLTAPALYRWRRDHPVTKDIFDYGSAAHELVLGKGAGIVVVDADSWRTKAAQEAKAAAHAEGKAPLLADEYVKAQAMADAVMEHDLARWLLTNSEHEVSAWAHDPETGVTIRCRFDCLGTGPAERIAADYKTSFSADPRVFARKAADFGYHMQAPWYMDLLALLGRPLDAFAWVVQEKEPPYLVSVVELDEESLDAGRRRNRRALEIFRDCTAAGDWPGYVAADDFATVALPRWALMEGTA